MKAVGVIDNHSGEHGPWVVSAVKQTWDGPIKKFDVGDDSATLGELAELLNEAGDRGDLVAVNLSFGGDTTTYPWGTVDDIEKAVRRLYRKGISVFMSAGNSGNTYGGISEVAAHPLVWTIGALTPTGAFAEFSQHYPESTHAFANGYLESEDSGTVRGTSFSSPRMCGAIASVRKRLGLTDLEARTAFRKSADFVQFRDDTPSNKDNGLRTFNYFRLNESELEKVEDASIDDRDIVLSMYHVLAGRMPSQKELDFHAGRLRSVILSTVLWDLGKELYKNDDWLAGLVPITTRVHSLYHLLWKKEPTPDQMLRHVAELKEKMSGPHREDNEAAWKSFVQRQLGKKSPKSEVLKEFLG